MLCLVFVVRVFQAEEQPPAPTEPYVWEDGGDENAPMTKRLAHTAHWAGASVVSGMEFVGEVVADFFGLTQSKFQYEIDMAERDAKRKAERKKDAEQRAELERERAAERARAAPPAKEDNRV